MGRVVGWMGPLGSNGSARGEATPQLQAPWPPSRGSSTANPISPIANCEWWNYQKISPTTCNLINRTPTPTTTADTAHHGINSAGQALWQCLIGMFICRFLTDEI